MPEVNEASQSAMLAQPAAVITAETGEVEYYIANYPYQSVEQGDLSFNAGEMITVLKKEGDWWTGKIGERTGIFPSNYVQKVDVVNYFIDFFLFDFDLTTFLSLFTEA